MEWDPNTRMEARIPPPESQPRTVEQLFSMKRTEAVLDQMMSFLKSCRLRVLQPLKDDMLRQLCASFAYVRKAKGDIVFRQGEKGHQYYVILKGTVAVYVTDEDSFDEVGKRASLKMTNSFSSLWDLFQSPQPQQQQHQQQHHHHHPQLQHQQQQQQSKTTPRSDYPSRPPPLGRPRSAPKLDISKDKRSSDAPRDERKQLRRSASMKSLQFTALSSGRASSPPVLQKALSANVTLQEPILAQRNLVNTVGKGDGFGELALLCNGNRTATIECQQDCEFLVLEKYDYDVAFELENIEIIQQIQFVRSLPLTRAWSTEDIVKLAYAFKRKSYPAQSVIVREGDGPSMVYFVKEGECTMTVHRIPEDSHNSACRKQASPQAANHGSRINMVEMILDVLGPRQVFGDYEIIWDTPQLASVTAVGMVVLYELSKPKFLRCLTGKNMRRAALLMESRYNKRRHRKQQLLTNTASWQPSSRVMQRLQFELLDHSALSSTTQDLHSAPSLQPFRAQRFRHHEPAPQFPAVARLAALGLKHEFTDHSSTPLMKEDDSSEDSVFETLQVFSAYDRKLLQGTYTKPSSHGSDCLSPLSPSSPSGHRTRLLLPPTEQLFRRMDETLLNHQNIESTFSSSFTATTTSPASVLKRRVSRVSHVPQSRGGIEDTVVSSMRHKPQTDPALAAKELMSASILNTLSQTIKESRFGLSDDTNFWNALRTKR